MPQINICRIFLADYPPHLLIKFTLRGLLLCTNDSSVNIDKGNVLIVKAERLSTCSPLRSMMNSIYDIMKKISNKIMDCLLLSLFCHCLAMYPMLIQGMAKNNALFFIPTGIL